MRASTGSSGAVRGSCRAGEIIEGRQQATAAAQDVGLLDKAQACGGEPLAQGLGAVQAQDQDRFGRRTGRFENEGGVQQALLRGPGIRIGHGRSGRGDGAGGVSAGREGRGSGQADAGEKVLLFHVSLVEKERGQDARAQKKGSLNDRTQARRAAAPEIRPARRAARRGRGPRGPTGPSMKALPWSSSGMWTCGAAAGLHDVQRLAVALGGQQQGQGQGAGTAGILDAGGVGIAHVDHGQHVQQAARRPHQMTPLVLRRSCRTGGAACARRRCSPRAACGPRRPAAGGRCRAGAPDGCPVPGG